MCSFSELHSGTSLSEGSPKNERTTDEQRVTSSSHNQSILKFSLIKLMSKSYNSTLNLTHFSHEILQKTSTYETAGCNHIGGLVFIKYFRG